MDSHVLRHTGQAAFHDGIIDELAFLAAWADGRATSSSAYLRVRQLRRANPTLLMQGTPFVLQGLAKAPSIAVPPEATLIPNRPYRPEQG